MTSREETQRRGAMRNFAEVAFDIDVLLAEIGDSIVHGFDPMEPTFESLSLESQVILVARLRAMHRAVLHLVGEPVLELATIDWLADPEPGRSDMASLFVEEWNFWDNALLPALQYWVKETGYERKLGVLEDVCREISECRSAILYSHWSDEALMPHPKREEAMEDFLRFCDGDADTPLGAGTASTTG